MTEFIPPYPYRLPAAPSPWQRMRLARKNFLSIFEEQAFEYNFLPIKGLIRDVFICNTADAVQFALSSHHDSFEKKNPSQRFMLRPLLGDGLLVSDGLTWKTRRQLIAPLINASCVAQFAPVMVVAACETRDRWLRLAHDEVDALGEMARLTAEIICRTLFGCELGGDRASQLVEGFTDYQRRIGSVDLLSMLGLPDWIPRPHFPGVYRSVARVTSVLDDVIADCSKSKSSVIGQLLEARPDAQLSWQAIRDEAAVLLMAGHETTANALAWTWYILSQTPTVEARLHSELHDVLGGAPPSLMDVPKLIYTRAILEEVMRLYPPAPILAREASREETFHGHRIRKGSLIFVCPWLLHRHRKLWRKPDHFIPERFLPGSDEPASKFVYIPFSIGPRICAGMAFGLTEAILVLATLAQNFRLHLKLGHQVEPTCRVSLRPGDVLPMRVSIRIPTKTSANVGADAQGL